MFEAAGMDTEKIHAMIAEADADHRPSLIEAEVDRHFQERLRRSLAIISQPSSLHQAK